MLSLAKRRLRKGTEYRNENDKSAHNANHTKNGNVIAVTKRESRDFHSDGGVFVD